MAANAGCGRWVADYGFVSLIFRMCSAGSMTGFAAYLPQFVRQQYKRPVAVSSIVGDMTGQTVRVMVLSVFDQGPVGAGMAGFSPEVRLGTVATAAGCHACIG